MDERLESSDPVVTAEARIGEADREYARDTIRKLSRFAPCPVLASRIVLQIEPNRSQARPAIAKAMIDIGGHVLHAHAAGEELREAIDLAEARLEGQLHELAEQSHEHPGRDWGKPWVDGAPGLLVHRVVTPVPQTPECAALELEAFAHDFQLYADATTGEDSVISRNASGTPVISSPSGAGASTAFSRERGGVPCTLERAFAQLDAENLSWLFFVDEETGRGSIVHRHGDAGHGLVAFSGSDGSGRSR